jgi:hypothetical protein
MDVREILSRLTGLSVPVFGVSWSPPEAERAVARRVIASPEDRRVLYRPEAMEIAEHCIRSVLDIRALLTTELGKLDAGTDLAASLRAMRSAARKFLDVVGSREPDIARHGFDQGHWASWIFLGALGELRGVFGIHLCLLAAKYGLPVEGELAAILPGPDDDGRPLHDLRR